MGVVWLYIFGILIGGEKSPLSERAFSAGSCSSWLLTIPKPLLHVISHQNGVKDPSWQSDPHNFMAQPSFFEALIGGEKSPLQMFVFLVKPLT